jgi:hypothetical protein
VWSPGPARLIQRFKAQLPECLCARDVLGAGSPLLLALFLKLMATSLITCLRAAQCLISLRPTRPFPSRTYCTSTLVPRTHTRPDSEANVLKARRCKYTPFVIKVPALPSVSFHTRSFLFAANNDARPYFNDTTLKFDLRIAQDSTLM